MPTIPIYTIGYGNRNIDDFIRLLHKYGIRYLADVRSHPYSRYQPEFSREALAKRLQKERIKYIFMGDTLGGRPQDTDCYDNGKVIYDRVREKDFFKKGIENINTAWKRQLSVALMCSEAKPQECHRSKLIGKILRERQIEVAHISETGETRTQEEINGELIGSQPSLFDFHPLLDNSRKKYSSIEENL